MQASQEVNVAFQGGGAKGFYYVGTHDALLKRNLKPKNVAGSSAGALQALFLALRVTTEDYRTFMIKEPGQQVQFGHINEIQDFIKAKTRQECLEVHYNILESYLKQEVRRKAGCFKAFLFNSLILPQIQTILDGLGASLSHLIFNAHGLAQKRMVPEMLLNGQLIYGQKLVHMLEDILNKYLEPYIGDQQKRKNITMAEFEATLGVNLILTASDLTTRDVRIFTATSTPNLPVKFACRISAGFPFMFPPMYWQQEWGKYADEDIVGHKLIDGGWLLNLPTVLLNSPSYFREKYLSPEPIPLDSIIGIGFDMKADAKKSEEAKEERVDFAKKVAQLPDKWPPILDEDYLKAIKHSIPFIAKCRECHKPITSLLQVKVPGFELMKELLDSKKDSQEIFSGNLFFKNTLLLDASNVSVLNFTLEGIDTNQEIKRASEVTEEFLSQKLN